MGGDDLGRHRRDHVALAEERKPDLDERHAEVAPDVGLLAVELRDGHPGHGLEAAALDQFHLLLAAEEARRHEVPNILQEVEEGQAVAVGPEEQHAGALQLPRRLRPRAHGLRLGRGCLCVIIHGHRRVLVNIDLNHGSMDDRLSGGCPKSPFDVANGRARRCNRGAKHNARVRDPAGPAGLPRAARRGGGQGPAAQPELLRQGPGPRGARRRRRGAGPARGLGRGGPPRGPGPPARGGLRGRRGDRRRGFRRGARAARGRRCVKGRGGRGGEGPAAGMVRSRPRARPRPRPRSRRGRRRPPPPPPPRARPGPRSPGGGPWTRRRGRI